MNTRRTLSAALFLVLAAAATCPGEDRIEQWPFFPSLINTVSGQPVLSTDFFPPRKCKGCHAPIYNQWKGSMHSNAYRDPVFRALWRMASDETQGLTDKLCAGCHTGVGTVSEEIRRGEDGDFEVSEIAAEGVQCHLCHSVVRSNMLQTPTHLPQNASIVLDPGLTMRGPYDDAKPAWHEAAYSELHTRAEFCGNCHNVFHPLTNFHVENTYTEWKFSVYAQKGIVCQDCHMMPVEKAIEVARTLERPKNPGKASPMGPPRENVFTHEFVGGNFTVPRMLGAEAHSEIAVRRLQSAAELELRLPEKAAAGNIARLTVRVHNVGAGHNLPTSLTEVRQMWLEVTVTGADGGVVYCSGALDENHDLTEGTVLFHAEAVDARSERTMKLWEIERFTYNSTIPAKGFADREFAFFVPAATPGPLQVGVRLRYRSFPQELARELLGAETPLLPIVDMATRSGVVRVE